MSEYDPTNKAEKVQTAQSGGKPAKRRIATAKAAHTLVKKLKDNDTNNAITRARIASIYNGNPPLSNNELRRRGLSWTSNVDWGEFRGQINKNATAVWNMFNSMEHLISCSPNLQFPQHPGVNFGQILSHEVSSIIRDWVDYPYTSMMQAQHLIKYGVGAITWDDPYDWRPRNIMEGCMLVPMKTKATPGDMNIVVLLDELSPYKVYELIKDEEAAEDLGWNVAKLKKEMVRKYVDGFEFNEHQDSNSVWESNEEMVATKVYEENEEDTTPIQIAHIYSAEFYSEDEDKPGISHNIIMMNDDDENEYLFEKENEYENITQLLHVYFYTIGSGKIKSIRGLGREIYYACHQSNRLLNNIINGTTITSGIMVKPTGEISEESMRVIRFGPVTAMPSNADIIQQQFHPNVKNAAEVRNLINAVSSNNKGGYRAHSEQANPVERTAREAELTFQQEATFEQDHAEWFYSQRTTQIREITRRLMAIDYPSNHPGYKQHKLLIDNLKKRGVPRELLNYDNWTIRVPRAVGMGNRAIAMSYTNQAVKMKGALDEDGRREVDRMWFAFRFGWDQVDLFVPRNPRDEVITIAHTLAEGENIDMATGHSRSVAVDDPHKIHLDIHLKGAAQILKSAMENQQPTSQALIGQYQGFQLILQHCVPHISQLAMDETRKAQVDKYSQGLKKMAAAGKELELMIKQIAQQEQQAQQQQEQQNGKQSEIDRDFQLGMYKIDREMAIKERENENMIANRDAKTVAGIRADMAELETKLTLMIQEAQAKVQANNEAGNNG